MDEKSIDKFHERDAQLNFTAERRRKEIGIRKILGSSELGIIYLLSSDFTRMVIVAIIIAIPASCVASKTWLTTFVYNANLQWWYFAVGGGASLLITWMTIGWLTLRAARTNPVEYIKYE